MKCWKLKFLCTIKLGFIELLDFQNSFYVEEFIIRLEMLENISTVFNSKRFLTMEYNNYRRNTFSSLVSNFVY